MTISYDFTQAAAELGVSEKWLRKHSTRLPRTKFGRTVRFTEEDIARIWEMHHIEPQTDASPPVSTASSSLHQLKPLPSRRVTRNSA
ncbi:helix-turn-helix domain-containing protein [Streptomyces sp. NPDC053499]|uniref:helix-turn-helix domain-containing protein n=1 Tax=Streptomyces sp. NPDC053499 TaxID=3365707 RepID=UPI0037D594C8